MINNAESNNTCLEHLVYEMVPRATEEDIKERRLRYWGHKLNLVIRAFFLERIRTSLSWKML
jgi:hypothetical protein